MFSLRIQAGTGGEDAADFAKSLSMVISKTTGVNPT